MKSCLGIEIGHYRVKIAYLEKGVLNEYISERIEADESADMKLYADTIQEVLKENGIRCKRVVFVLRQEDTYVKRFQLPLMTAEQLKLNLPYEFHDYTGDQLNAYQYDYAVLGRTEDSLDLMAAACSKEMCQRFQKLAKLAKLKVVGMVPSVIGLERILERAEGGETKDYALLDLGTRAVRIHFFRKGIYDITRTMEPGCEEIERIQNQADEDLEAGLEEQYRTISVQVMRVLNFYSFNNADNTIDTLYYCGGGARYEKLIQTLSDTLDIPVKSMNELAPEIDSEDIPEWIDSPQAYGVLLV